MLKYCFKQKKKKRGEQTLIQTIVLPFFAQYFFFHWQQRHFLHPVYSKKSTQLSMRYLFTKDSQIS